MYTNVNPAELTMSMQDSRRWGCAVDSLAPFIGKFIARSASTHERWHATLTQKDILIWYRYAIFMLAKGIAYPYSHAFYDRPIAQVCQVMLRY